MSNIYIINNTSGEALFAIQPKATNGPGSAGHNTDLTLYGYGAPNWGERFNENFYRLLENFACAEKEPGDVGYDALSPSPKSEGDVGITEKYGVNKPILGQTWFNTTRDRLFVCVETDPVVTWLQVASDDTGSSYVQKAGDIMTGFLTLHSHPVESMHAATKGYVDTSIVSAGGSFVRKSGDTMNTGQTLVLGRDPVGDMDAVTKQYVDSVAGAPGPINDPVKIGTVVPFAGTTTPENWLPCYGQAVSRTTYNLLFGVIGTSYGAGDGTTTFNVPDFRGRMPIGLDNMGGTSANVITNTNADTLGGKFGSETHTLTLNEIPSHTHTGSVTASGGHTHTGSTSSVGDHSHTFPGNIAYTPGSYALDYGAQWYHNYTNHTNPAGAHSHTMSLNAVGDHSHTITINSAGSSAAHDNVQPSLTMYYIIKAKPEPTTIGGVSGDYVARGGDSMYGSLTMTGATDITLARAPTQPMHAVTKQYVDTVAGSGGGPAFGTIVVAGQSNIIADTTTDTLNLVAGTGITLTTDAASDTITISSTGSGVGEIGWTYRTTITTTTLLSTASYVNCGSTPTFTVPGTGTRKCIIVAHVPVDVYGYPNQVYIRMLLDGVVVDHDSFNINPSVDATHAGQSLSFQYTGDIAPGSHTISFQGKLDTTSTLESGDWVRVNGAHGPSSNTNVDTYTRVDVFVDGTGGSVGSGTTVTDVSAIGTIVPFAGMSAPVDWLLCHGQAVSRTTYSELFAVIGTTYGAGDGNTTFNVPDFRGRVPVGLDNMGGASANTITNANADLLGGKFGSENHTLTLNEIPSHHHTGYFPSQPGTQIQSGTGWGNSFLNTGDVGGSGAHNNVQPSITMNYIIKAKSEGVATDLSNYYNKQEVDNLLASVGTGTSVSVLSGTIADGGTIPLPDGYTQAECKWMVSPNTFESTANQYAIDKIYCRADSNRVVYAKCSIEENSTLRSGTANYIIVGTRGTPASNPSDYYTKTESDALYAPAGTVTQTPWTVRSSLAVDFSVSGTGATTAFTVPGTGTRKCMITVPLSGEGSSYTVTSITLSLQVDGVSKDSIQVGVFPPPGATGDSFSWTGTLAYVGDITAGAHSFKVRASGSAVYTNTHGSGTFNIFVM